jgi:hypothetical protein
MNWYIRAKTNPNPKTRDYASFSHEKSMKVLLDNLGHGRRLLTKGNDNTLHGYEGIIDHVKSMWGIPWTGANPVETGSKEERGWNPLGITKKIWGEPQIAQESPKLSVGEVLRRKKFKWAVKGQSKDFIPRGTGLVRWRDRTFPVEPLTGLVWWD